jgi:hypothetical protein
MNYSIDKLKDKILTFHPEIDQNGMNLEVGWDEDGKRFALKLSKAGEAVGGYLYQEDADECMSGQKCLNLAILVTQMIAELEDLVTPRKPG